MINLRFHLRDAMLYMQEIWAFVQGDEQHIGFFKRFVETFNESGFQSFEISNEWNSVNVLFGLLVVAYLHFGPAWLFSFAMSTHGSFFLAASIMFPSNKFCYVVVKQNVIAFQIGGGELDEPCALHQEIFPAPKIPKTSNPKSPSPHSRVQHVCVLLR